jgi:perosamine synthetase
VTCFSFYANKTITTGEGGMAVTDDDGIAARLRCMSLHGLSQDAWKRFSGGAWDYRITAPGFKYNLTDLASSIGIHQLRKAEQFRQRREDLADRYRAAFADVPAVELPEGHPDRLHSWHLFPLRLRLDRLSIDRDAFIEEIKARGIGCSVHWRPLHLHPYYEDTFGWQPDDLPVASRVWPRLVSLPLFPGMTEAEFDHVVAGVGAVCKAHAVRAGRVRRAA